MWFSTKALEIELRHSFNRQHVSEKEEDSGEDASADKDEINDIDDDDKEEEAKKHSINEHVAVRSRSNAQHKHPKNLIKMVLIESKDGEQEEKSLSQEQDESLSQEQDEENSGQDSGSSSSFVPRSGNTAGQLEEEHPILKPHPNNMTGVKTHTSTKDVARKNVTLHTDTSNEEKKGIDNKNKQSGAKSTDKTERKNDSKSTQHKDKVALPEAHNDKVKSKETTKEKVQHTHGVQNTQVYKKLAKKAEPVRTPKVAVHLAKQKLHNKYLAVHVTHPHVVKSHTKVIHRKPVTKGTVCHTFCCLR